MHGDGLPGGIVPPSNPSPLQFYGESLHVDEHRSNYKGSLGVTECYVSSHRSPARCPTILKGSFVSPNPACAP